MKRLLRLTILFLLIAVVVGVGFGWEEWLAKRLWSDTYLGSASVWIATRFYQLPSPGATVQIPGRRPVPPSVPDGYIKMKRAATDGLRTAAASLIAMVAFIIVFRWRKGPLTRETTCRACGHVLRGLREPCCPKCDERI